jgi:hypothetical protein
MHRIADDLCTTLRLGTVLGGTLVDERFVRDRDIVTVGQSTKNTVNLPIEAAPRAWPLFRRVGGQYLISIADDMDGRLSQGGVVRSFDEVRRTAKRARGGCTIPLDVGARGKVVISDATILFQLVRVPVQPRPTLPKSVRGSLTDRINPLLSAIVAVSLIVHGAFAYWLYQRDVKTKTRLEQIAEAPAERPQDMRAIIVSADFLDTIEPIARPGADVRVPGDTSTPQTDPPRSDRTNPRIRGDRPGRGDISDAQLQEIIDGTAALQILNGGPGADSRYAKMAGVDPGTDLDQSLRHLGSSGIPIVTNRPDGLLVRDGTDHSIIRGDGPDVDGPRDIDRTVKSDDFKAPPPKITEVDPIDPDGIDPAEIRNIIRRRYLKGIQRCHNDLLVDDAGAGGRVDIVLTVGKVGKVTRAEVDGFDPGLDSCVQGLAMRWRFPVAMADGVPVEVNYMTTFMLKAPGR